MISIAYSSIKAHKRNTVLTKALAREENARINLETALAAYSQVFESEKTALLVRIKAKDETIRKLKNALRDLGTK